MEVLREKLQLSISQYRAILLQLNQLEGDMHTWPGEKLGGFAQTYSQLQEAIEENDRLIAELCHGRIEVLMDNRLFRQRIELMQQVQERNQLLSQKIRGIMSVVSSELSQVRSGRTAMTGYGGARDRKGAKINSNY